MADARAGTLSDGERHVPMRTPHMDKRVHRVWVMLASASLAVLVVLSVDAADRTPRAAAAAGITLPDLRLKVPVVDISIGTNPSTGHRQLQFTHVTWDGGAGPFVIQPRYDAATGVSGFVQDVYRMPHAGVWRLDHTFPIAVAGTFDAPSDYRFPLTRFTLNVANANGTPGRLVAASPKTDYCITGDAIVGGVPNTPSQTSPPQGNCTNPAAALGFSVGWGDQYDQTDNGQPIDLTGVPDGTYVLHAIVDPQHVLTESVTTNDVVDTRLQLSGATVTVLSQRQPTTFPPAIALTSPRPGTRVRRSVALTVRATATAPAVVRSVRYLLDGEPLGPVLTSAPFRFTWGVASTTLGSHLLSAQVTDSNGNVATARPDRVTVVPGSAGGLSINASLAAIGHGAVTTSPFSTSRSGDVLVAFAALDGPSAGTQTTRVSGAGLTWHLVARAAAQPGDAEAWTARARGRLTRVRVTSTPSAGGFAQQLVVIALTGAASVGASARASASSGAPTVALRAKSAGSLTLADGADWDHATARTPAHGQSLLYQWVDAGDGDTFWVQGSAARSGAAGKRITLADTAPRSDEWNMVGVEVRPVAAAAPQVTIVNPVPHATVSASTHLAAALSDPAAARAVRFAVDGSPIGAVLSHAPFVEPRWDTRTLRNGRHLVTVIATDALGRTVRTSAIVTVANPAPAMTCFVLQDVASAHGRGRVTTRLHTAAPGERLVAFVQRPHGSTTLGRVTGGGLAWRLVRRSSSAAGALAVWSALAPRVLPAARITSRGAGLRVLTVVAMEGTTGPGASVAAAGLGDRPVVRLTTTRPTALGFSAGIVGGSSTHVPPGWAPISRWSARTGAWSTWVQYTNQPASVAGTEVAIPVPSASRGRWTTIALELPGTGG